MLEIWINTVLCAALFYTCFCRLVRTDKGTTLASVRAGFFVLGAATFCCGVAPFLWAYSPQVPALLVQGAITLVQGITARHWQHGVPCQFRKEQP